jgi:hypothetical protein
MTTVKHFLTVIHDFLTTVKQRMAVITGQNDHRQTDLCDGHEQDDRRQKTFDGDHGPHLHRQ